MPLCMPQEANDFASWQKTKDTENSLRQAAVKTTNVWIAHMLAGVFASLYYGNKTKNWVPTAVATGVAVVSFPIIFLEATGLLWSIAPAATGAAMVCTRANNKRKELGLNLPEEAVFKLEKGEF